MQIKHNYHSLGIALSETPEGPTTKSMLSVCVECFLATGNTFTPGPHDHTPWVHFRADLYKAPYIAEANEVALWNLKYCHENQQFKNWTFTQNRNGENDTLTLCLTGKGIWVWKLPEELDHATSGKVVEIKWPD